MIQYHYSTISLDLATVLIKYSGSWHWSRFYIQGAANLNGTSSTKLTTELGMSQDYKGITE